MPTWEEVAGRLASIPNLRVSEDVPLASCTRFGIGGPADALVETASAGAFVAAWQAVRDCGLPVTVIGGGTNLIVSDEGFRGVVLRFTGEGILAAGKLVIAEAGAQLHALVGFAIERGLKGFETLARIPGSVGAAIYGNAGAYGHSISERVRRVRFFGGDEVRVFDNTQCEFAYRESVFKRHKGWVIFSAELVPEPGDRAELRRIAREIEEIRDQKFPPEMKCAGSIFKNLLLAALPEPARRAVPPDVVREGKVPAAYFLEQVGAKDMQRGNIHVASYHANLIYNAGGGTARDLRDLIRELKTRVSDRFGVELEEEVQYLGFDV